MASLTGRAYWFPIEYLPDKPAFVSSNSGNPEEMDHEDKALEQDSGAAFHTFSGQSDGVFMILISEEFLRHKTIDTSLASQPR